MSDKFNMSDVLYTSILSIGKNHTEKATFSPLVDDLVNHCVNFVCENGGIVEKREQIRTELKKQNHFINKRDPVLRTCHTAMDLRDKLLDAEFQLSKATTRDHIKMWVFKTITGITIATIILCTAIVASELGLQIPLIRVG
ncbi:MAG: hypothetical protein HQ498_09285 [Pseudohongiella sp.]|nr:hypothetical protein [Pseudohongiella sp.]